MNGSHVSLESTPEHETLLTFLAFERFFHGVRRNVSLQIMLHFERFLTQTTAEWFFQCVEPNVIFQAAERGNRSGTKSSRTKL